MFKTTFSNGIKIPLDLEGEKKKWREKKLNS